MGVSEGILDEHKGWIRQMIEEGEGSLGQLEKKSTDDSGISHLLLAVSQKWDFCKYRQLDWCVSHVNVDFICRFFYFMCCLCKFDIVFTFAQQCCKN